jgi:hypothetical protein
MDGNVFPEMLIAMIPHSNLIVGGMPGNSLTPANFPVPVR